MKWFEKFFHFYLDANVHVALAVYALARVTMVNYEVGYDEDISYALFFGTIVEYGFIKYATLAKHYLFVTQKYLKRIQLFNVICFFIAMFYVFRLNIKTLLMTGALVLVAFLYVVPSLTGHKNLRSLKGTKAFIVSLTWSVSTVVLPLLNNDMPITSEVYLSLVQRFVFILALMIPFEIRDLKTDEPWLKTLPQVLGMKGVKVFGTVLMVLFVLFSLFKQQITWQNQMVEWGIAVITLLAVLYASRDRSSYYAGFFVESISVVWWLGLLFMGSS